MKKLIPLLFFQLYSAISFSQVDYKLSTFSFNPIHYNPGFAGVPGNFTAIGINSIQFSNFQGNPTSQFISLNHFISDKKVGLGLDISNDQFGTNKETTINSNFSYILTLNENFKLAFGLKAGVKSMQIDFSHLNIYDPDEDIFLENQVRHLTPNLGFGTYLFSNNFHLGISTPTFFYQNAKETFSNIFKPGGSNFYLMTGYKKELSQSYNFQSNVLVRVVDGAPFSGLLTLMFDYKETFLIGSNFELNSSIGPILGFRVFENFLACYAIDFSINNFQRHNSGSHTFVLSYNTNKKRD